MTTYKHDVFLSHNSKDKPAVKWLAIKLEDEAKIKVFLDIWNLIPGAPWQEDLENALDASRTVAVFLGPAGVSGWHNEELRDAINTRVRDPERRVVPVLLPGTTMPQDDEIPNFLQRLTWVDFRAGLDDEEAFRSLVAGIRGQAPGRSGKDNESAPPEEATNLLSFRDKRALDAAIAKCIPVGLPTELFVMVRKIESDGLKAILRVEFDDLQVNAEDVQSKDFCVEFPIGPDKKPKPISLALAIHAPGFEPNHLKESIMVRPEEDGEHLVFLLTPLQKGNLKLMISLYKENFRISSQFLKTLGDMSCGAESTFSLVTLVFNVQGDLNVGENKVIEQENINLVEGDLHKFEKPNIKTSGGAYVGGNVNTGGGDFVGRDKNVTAERGGVVIGGNVTGSNIVTGDNNVITTTTTVTLQEQYIQQVYEAITERPDTDPLDKEDMKVAVEEIQQEDQKGADAEESFISRRLRNIQRIAPDILDVAIAGITNPVAGFGMVAKKVAEKMKANAG